MRRIVIIITLALAAAVLAYLFLSSTEKTQVKLPTFVTLTYRLPADKVTDLIILQGCTGSEVSRESGDGPHGRLLCNGPWAQLGSVNHEAVDVQELQVTVPLQPGQGVEFNWNFENLSPSWAVYGDPIQSFGVTTAVTSTGRNLLVLPVDNRQGGGNDWIYWPQQ